MYSAPTRREDLLLRTKLAPPQVHSRVLPRPALAALLRESLQYRLTVVHAGTGYSKTTALAALDNGETPLFWYTLGDAENDPQRFLSYLISAFRVRTPGMSDLPIVILQERGSEGSKAAWVQALDALINALAESPGAPALLVLDDYHFVGNSPEITALVERFLEYLPPNLHVIVSTRYPFASLKLVTWRARGEVLEIGRKALAFGHEEVEALFRDIYKMDLAPEELHALVEKTEGWPIALQLVWQGLRGGTTRSAARLLEQGSTSLSALFDYLASDVLGAQPPGVASFLRDTAILRELTPASCDAITGGSGSSAMLDRLLEMDLFMVALGDPAERHYRYHHLFHDFLRQQSQADVEGTRTRHHRAAEFFASAGDYEEAIYHWLAAGDLSQVAGAIERAGETALRAGWLDTVATWIDPLPPDLLADHPLLQAFLGDIYRMRSRFDEALAWYAEAERVWRARNDRAGTSRALRGQALVYLDTVRPARAESLLEEALRLIEGLPDREARARLLELLAENKLNMGKPSEAEELRAEARSLREEGPGEDTLSVRVKLRTGRLDEAQRTLEQWAEAERREVELGQVHPPRSHRETLLILSLIHSFRGQPERAMELAQEAIDVARRLDSPFIEAVGQTRLGHALQIRRDRNGLLLATAHIEEAIRGYGAAVALGDRLAVRRMRGEAMWGLTRAYGFSGDLASAERSAAEGAEIGRWAGDAWIVALIELTLGASYVLAGQPQRAADLLSQVLVSFRGCGDSFGRAATRLWLALAYHDLGQVELCNVSIDESLALCEAHGYDFLFTVPSLLGPPDIRRAVPLLLRARDNRRNVAYVVRLLSQVGLPDAQVHPGYRLRVYLLGTFRVFRGDLEVEPREWQRDKARQLFQLLLAQRGRWLQRDEVVERLWPNLSPEAALRDFKVALNALNKAIEPGHASDSPFAYIVRDGVSYRIRPEADLWLDTDEFERLCHDGSRLADAGAGDGAVATLRSALELYAGNYLPDALYEDWASTERERLLSIFSRAADRLAGLLVERGQYDEALEICARILSFDPCWEGAYRWMMLAYAHRGDRTLALRAYQRCRNTMSAELGVAPAPATTALYNRLLHAEDLPVTAL
ncbi:MAG TPA: BTAD domain-containing putative transcriptional regulator [Chloroflexia bacterium]|jgi:DNA-binding SARP family transcriptional activator